jgi:hypothetical protein
MQGNEVTHFMSRQLASLSRLGSLCHLDLQVVCMSQIRAGHSKATTSHLLDCRALVVFWVLVKVPVSIFACNSFVIKSQEQP